MAYSALRSLGVGILLERLWLLGAPTLARAHWCLECLLDYIDNLLWTDLLQVPYASELLSCCDIVTPISIVSLVPWAESRLCPAICGGRRIIA